MIKLLLTILLALTPLFCYSCNNKDIGKEVGNRINGENQKLIEELNGIIIKQRKEIELLKKRYYEEYLEEEIKKIEDTKTYKLLDEILKEMQRKTKDYNEIHKKLVKLEDTKIMEKMREWGIEKLVKSYEKETKDLREKLKDLEDKLKQK